MRSSKAAELRFSWGGRARIDGDGISEGHATAAHFGNLAGRTRAEELLADKIEHALAARNYRDQAVETQRIVYSWAAAP